MKRNQRAPQGGSDHPHRHHNVNAKSSKKPPNQSARTLIKRPMHLVDGTQKSGQSSSLWPL
jgi:hypothetical protein